jgi:hypothetical protein
MRANGGNAMAKRRAAKATKGRGTKQERKDLRRVASKRGNEPTHARRTDGALPGAAKQRLGPRTRGGAGRA